MWSTTQESNMPLFNKGRKGLTDNSMMNSLMEIQEKLIQDKIAKRQKEIPVKKEANIPVFPKPERIFPEEKLPTSKSVLPTNKADPLEIGVNPVFEDGKFLKSYTKGTLEELRSKSKSATAGGADKNALIDASVDEGKQVGIRLNLGSNIPDSTKGLNKLQTVHEKNYNGKALSYQPFVTVQDAVFTVSQTGRRNIASKIQGLDVPEAKDKFPAMSVDGKYTTARNVLEEMDEGVVEIGFNPANTHLFVDMKTGQAVKSADIATVVGDRIFAKGVKYMKKADAPKPMDASDGTKLNSEVRYKFKKGGTMLGQQTEMAFMNEGGMKDDGGKTEPTSGNKVPSGSLEEEVADDIPAMLSEGEFVFPADVVRYIGLGTLMKMRQDAKQGLKMMEKMGQLGNPEEAEIPDDVPFGMADLVVISGEMEDKEKKAEGGAVGLANGGSLLDDPRFQTGDSGQDPTVYTPEEEQEIKGALDEPMQPSDIQIKKVINPDDPNDFMMWSFDKEGNPLYPIPDGYVVDDTPVEDSYSNTISRRGDPRDTDSSDDSSPAPDGMGSGMTLPKESDFVDSDQYKKGQYALYSRGKPIRLQETTLNNLSMEYDKLKKLDGMEKLTFQDYYNLPNYDKARFSLGMTLGRDPTVAEINAAITQAQKSPTGLLSFLNPVVGAIKSFLSPDASGGFTDDDYRKQRDQRDTAVKNLTNLVDPRSQSPYGDAKGVVSEADYQKYKRDTELQSQARFPSTGKVGKVDDFLLGVRRDPTGKNPPTIFKGNRNPDGTPKYENLTADALGRIEKNRQDVADKAFENFQKEAAKLRPDIQAAEESAGQGDLDTVAQNKAFDQQMQEAQAIARGTPRSSSSGGGGASNFGYGTDAGFGYGGSDVITPFYVGGVPTKPMKPQTLKKGGIASPKAKPKRMKKGGLASKK